MPEYRYMSDNAPLTLLPTHAKHRPGVQELNSNNKAVGCQEKRKSIAFINDKMLFKTNKIK
jgi:hypothetical protein